MVNAHLDKNGQMGSHVLIYKNIPAFSEKKTITPTHTSQISLLCNPWTTKPHWLSTMSN